MFFSLICITHNIVILGARHKMSINISISNLAKIKKADVKINGLTVISGENDTGKSTVGKAIYSIVKSVSTYNNSGVLRLKRILLNEAREVLRIMGRSARKTQKFIKLRNDIFYYIQRNDPIQIALLNTSSEDYEKRVESLTFPRLLELVSRLSSYAQDKKYWDDDLLKNKLDSLMHLIKSTSEDSTQLRTELLFQFKATIGNVFTNSLHPNDNGNIILSLNNDAVLNLDFCKDGISVHPDYDKSSFEYIFDDATYIETPLLINEEFNIDYNPRSSFADIKNKIKSAGNPEKKIEYITNYIPGEINYEDGKYSYKVSSKAEKLTLSTMASGVKTFNILQLLAQGGYIGGVSKLLIVDEPENHLHPEWQLKYAELMVSLVAQGANIILTSHSPYMIEALYYYAKKNSLNENKVAFYYTEKTNIENYTEIKETKDLSIIFDKLSKPLEKIVWD